MAKILNNKNVYAFALLAILIFAGWIRLNNLTERPMWFDEIGSAVTTSSGVKEIFEFCLKDTWPPAYHLMLYGVKSVIGNTDFTNRFVSVVFGVLTVWAVFLLGRALFGKKEGLIAAFLLSFSPLHVYYSQEARGWAMFCLLVTLAAYCFAKINFTDNKKFYVYYVIISVLYLYTNLYGIIIFTSFCVISFLSPRRKNFFMLNAATALCFTPWLYIVFTRVLPYFSDVDFHLQNTYFACLSDVSKALLPSGSIIFYAVALGFIFVYFIRVFFKDKNLTPDIFITLLVSLSIVLVFALSLKKQVWQTRYFVVFAPLFFLIVARSVSIYKSNVLIYAFLTVFAALSFFKPSVELYVPHYFTGAKALSAYVVSKEAEYPRSIYIASRDHLTPHGILNYYFKQLKSSKRTFFMLDGRYIDYISKNNPKFVWLASETALDSRRAEIDYLKQNYALEEHKTFNDLDLYLFKKYEN
jgi:uncharacterized membrane protein